MHLLPFLVASIAMYFYSMFTYSIPYQQCVMHNAPAGSCVQDDPFGWQMNPQCNPCYEEYEAIQNFTHLSWVISLVQGSLLCVILGGNRQKLQLARGMPDAGPVNYILYAPCVAMCFAPCAQCQESRAVKQRWLANGQ